MSAARRGVTFAASAKKAITAAAVGFAGALGAALLDGNLTGAEALVSAGMGLLAGVATYKVPNAETDPS